jgi:hypothetical protein
MALDLTRSINGKLVNRAMDLIDRCDVSKNNETRIVTVNIDGEKYTIFQDADSLSDMMDYYHFGRFLENRQIKSEKDLVQSMIPLLCLKKPDGSAVLPSEMWREIYEKARDALEIDRCKAVLDMIDVRADFKSVADVYDMPDVSKDDFEIFVYAEDENGDMVKIILRECKPIVESVVDRREYAGI